MTARHKLNSANVIGCLLLAAVGRDASPVIAEADTPPAKSVGNSYTLHRDSNDNEHLLRVLLGLSAKVGRRLRERTRLDVPPLARYHLAAIHNEETTVTDRERFVRTLTGQEVDRVPFMKIFGGTNAMLPHWETECPGLRDTMDEMLRFEGAYRGWDTTAVNTGLSRVPPSKVIEETDTKVVCKNGDGSVHVRTKDGDYHQQTLRWAVADRDDWVRVKDLHLDPDDPARFRDDWAESVERYRGRTFPLQLTHGGVYGFARNLMGDEALAYAFYDEPDTVRDIMDTYTDMVLAVWTKMVAEVNFDLIEFWEDMCFRSGCLVSPKMFREFMTPQYRKVAAFAREHGIPIILVDSDGYIENLTELMAEAGVTAMYPYEVQSGNDVRRVREKFPEFGVIGALNKEVMAWGREAIDAEIERARDLIHLGRLIPGPDHFVLSNVTFENYRYFMERLREVVMMTKPRG